MYPYDLGWKRNFGQVITWTGEPPHDGTWWPVVEECDQFTFTVRILSADVCYYFLIIPLKLI